MCGWPRWHTERQKRREAASQVARSMSASDEAAPAASGSDERRQADDEYMRRHGLDELFRELADRALEERPDDAAAFFAEVLQEARFAPPRVSQRRQLTRRPAEADGGRGELRGDAESVAPVRRMHVACPQPPHRRVTAFTAASAPRP